MNNFTKTIIGAILGSCTVLQAEPSGLHEMDLKIPKVPHNIPVHLIPDTHEENLFYVVPLSGRFSGMGAIRSPETDCSAVKTHVKIRADSLASLATLSQLTRDQTAKKAALYEDYKKAINNFEKADSVITEADARLTEMSSDSQEQKTQMLALEDKIEEEKLILRRGNNDEERKKTSARIDVLNVKLRAIEDQYLKTKSAMRKLKTQRWDLVRARTTAEAHMKSYEKSLSHIAKMVAENDLLIKTIQNSADSQFDRYMTKLGGIVTYRANFAPSEYITALSDAHPGNRFQYIRSTKANVGSSIPAGLKDDSPLQGALKHFILSTVVSDPGSAPSLRNFVKRIDEVSRENSDPLKELQNRPQRFENALAGEKLLSVYLSNVGYCALLEPHSFKSDFVDDHASTFQMVMYFTYRLKYNLALSGSYNSYKMQYHFYKHTKSSEWFGLKRKEKIKSLKRFESKDYMDIDVKNPSDLEMSAEQSLQLVNMIKEQLLFMSLKDHLDLSGGTEKLGKMVQYNHELGAMQAIFPSPWIRWTGFIRNTLGDMFGSQSKEIEETVIESKKAELHWNAGFTLEHSGDMTVGDFSSLKERK